MIGNLCLDLGCTILFQKGNLLFTSVQNSLVKNKYYWKNVTYLYWYVLACTNLIEILNAIQYKKQGIAQLQWWNKINASYILISELFLSTFPLTNSKSTSFTLQQIKTYLSRSCDTIEAPNHPGSTETFVSGDDWFSSLPFLLSVCDWLWVVTSEWCCKWGLKKVVLSLCWAGW